MARLVTARSRLGLLLALLVPLLTVALAADSTLAPCYLPNGKVAPLGINPCGPTSSGNATHCCGGSDYCLNNGLCLNAGGSNEITQQACTDKNWDSPCHKYCPDTDINPADGYIYLIYCVTLNSTSAGYCCGTDRSCCSDTTDLISIHLFSQAVHPAGEVADTPTGPSNSPSSPPTSTASSAAGSNPTSAGDGQASGSWGSPDSGLTGRIAGVAVGVAAAVCAAVVAVVFMCLRHRRRQHQGMAAAAAMASPATGRHGSSHGPTRDVGRSSHDAEMQSIEYKEPMATTTAAAACAPNVAEVGSPSRSPPPHLHDQYDSVVSPGSETPGTAVSMGTLPTYTSGGAAARRHGDPDKAGNPPGLDQSDTAATIATGAAFSAPPPAAGPHAAQLHQPQQRHLPLAAELHGQPTAFEMSSEPSESPQELDGGSGSQSARLPPDGTGNNKYRF